MRPRIALSVLREMFREEWRLHIRIAGGERAVMFPIILSGIIGLSMYYLSIGDRVLDLTIAIFHLFVFLVGLQLGSIEFSGRDTIEDMFNDVTFLLYSSRALPVSSKELLLMFLIKEVVYYSGFLVLPIVVGMMVIVPISMFPFLTLSLIGMFAFGLVTSLVGISAILRGKEAGVGAALVIGLVIYAWINGVPIIRFIPYIIYVEPSLMSAVSGLLSVIIVGFVGWLWFDPTVDQRLRIIESQYNSIYSLVPGKGRAVAAKSLLDIHRSKGGLLKVFASISIIFSVIVYFLMTALTRDGVLYGMLVGMLLSLSPFVTYTWIVRFDTLSDYTFLPLDADDVVKGKAVAFIGMTLPVSVFFYFISALIFNVTLLDFVAGAVVLSGFSMYFVGVVMYTMWFTPKEALYDGVKLGALAASTCIPLIPFIVYSMSGQGVDISAISIIVLNSIMFGAVGYWLVASASDRWI